MKLIPEGILSLHRTPAVPYEGWKLPMQYSVRNRRRLRQTGEQVIPRTVTARGTGVADTAVSGAPVEVRAEGSSKLQVKEITPASVIKLNWQR